MSDVVILGGGVIGLSLAYELGRRGAEVTVVDTCCKGQASWAGAGILVPTNEQTAIHPLEKIRGMSSRLHAEWATQLLAETEFDNGYLQCGGVYVARSAGEVAALRGFLGEWADFEIEHKLLDDEQLDKLVPPIALLAKNLRPEIAAWTPTESQICNPRHLKALSKACQIQGAKLLTECKQVDLLMDENRIRAVNVDGQTFEAEAYCVSAGAWSENLLVPLGVKMPVIPVRGQMILFKLKDRIFTPVIYEGSRYVVPRADGHVLVGSTIEETGFNVATRDEDITELMSFAASLIPQLDDSTFIKCWAGLRPATFDGFPYMGQIPNFANAFVSTGHFKAGLHLSTGCAVVMADLIEGKQAPVDLGPFDLARVILSNFNQC